jgi:hypothetical protein
MPIMGVQFTIKGRLFMRTLLTVLMVSFVYTGTAFCGAVNVDINVVQFLESSNREMAYNRASGARGLMQITPICLKEWNQFHKNERYGEDDLFRGDINRRIGAWYINERIPAMLRHYGVKDGVEARLWAYNAGIGRVLKGIKPTETREYIRRYQNARI